MDINLIPIILFSFLSYLSVAFAGFGGILIPVALGTAFYSIDWMLAILIPLSLVSNGEIIIRHFRQINFPVLFKRILPFMGIGLVIGMVIISMLHGEIQKRLFGVLVVILSLRELILLRLSGRNPQPAGLLKSFLYILSAGVVQGMYGSGGPLLVYIVNKIKLGKSEFRSTLSVVWFSMNTILTISFIISGKVTVETIKTSTILLPSLVLGIMAGEYLHTRISDRIFRICIYIMLFFSGLSIMFN